MRKDLAKLFFTGLVIVLGHTFVWAGNLKKEGYEIKIKLSDFSGDTIYLGYHLAAQTYIKDTAVLDKKTGFYTFEDKKDLEPGVYLIVTPPDNSYFQVMINPDEQFFSVETTMKDPYGVAKVKGSKDTEAFYSYMIFLTQKNKEANDAKALLGTPDSMKAKGILENLDKDVIGFQQNIVKTYPKTVSAVMIKAAVDIEIPKSFQEIKDPQDKQMQMYLYYKQHFFDNYELGNPALLRTPIIHERIERYVDKMTPQHPDSVAIAIDYILEKVKPAHETFQYYVVHFLNTYAKSKLVGFDAVYVHIAKKYIESGLSDDIIEKENREKIISNANKLFPILIGKKAPDIKVFKQDNSMISLYDIKAKYVVLYFWDPDCGHCNKQAPELVAFANKWRGKVDFQIITVCSKGPSEVSKCWEAIEKKEFTPFINTIDPYMISRYKALYNVETTPQTFVLDANKIIQSKSISADQLNSVFEFLTNEEKQ